MGTLVLVLIGNGVVANVVLKKTLGSAAGWLTIVFGFGLGVVAGVFTAIACGSSDAHINPAVTLAFAISSGDFSKFLPYLIAQVLGGFVGGMLVWIHFLPHWKETPDAGSKLACFSTGPAIKNTVANLISEVIGTFLLVLTIASIVKTSPAPGLVPFLVGAMVWAIGSGLGGTTGFAINPARDLGPRIAHAILPIPGKGGSDFGYGLSVPVLGGLIGGALAGLFIRVAHL
ncbi:MAG: aquaporin family protein [Acidobacteriia bacterium]|nr:aquaporin family protein [Terriglobia bacterium]